MTNQQFFILALTFFVGIITGAYVYVTGFAPNYNDDGIADSSSDSALVIRAERFGGCQAAGNVCASFELTDDKKYQYIPAYKIEDKTPIAITGKINGALYAEVEEDIQNANFVELNKAGSKCNAASDDIDYKYDISIKKALYKLDSCGTQFAYSPLYKSLLKIWNNIESPEPIQSKSEFEGIGGALINRFGE